MKIIELAETPTDSVFTEEFFVILESYMPLLRKLPVKYIPVEAKHNIACCGDFLKLLVELKVEKKYHYVVMSFNGYTHQSDYNTDIDVVAVPDEGLIEEILSTLRIT